MTSAAKKPQSRSEEAVPDKKGAPGTGSAASTGLDHVNERGEKPRTKPTSAAGYTDMDSGTGELEPTGGGSTQGQKKGK